MSNAYCLLPLASGLGLGMPPTGPQRTRRSSARRAMTCRLAWPLTGWPWLLCLGTGAMDT